VCLNHTQACRNHSRKCQNYTRVCGSLTLQVEITLVRVVIADLFFFLLSWEGGITTPITPPLDLRLQQTYIKFDLIWLTKTDFVYKWNGLIKNKL
jgi:hypothetical protein